MCYNKDAAFSAGNCVRYSRDVATVCIAKQGQAGAWWRFQPHRHMPTLLKLTLTIGNSSHGAVPCSVSGCKADLTGGQVVSWSCCRRPQQPSGKLRLAGAKQSHILLRHTESISDPVPSWTTLTRLMRHCGNTRQQLSEQGEPVSMVRHCCHCGPTPSRHSSRLVFIVGKQLRLHAPASCQ